MRGRAIVQTAPCLFPQESHFPCINGLILEVVDYPTYCQSINAIIYLFVGGWVGWWCWVASSAGGSYYFGIW